MRVRDVTFPGVEVEDMRASMGTHPCECVMRTRVSERELAVIASMGTHPCECVMIHGPAQTAHARSASMGTHPCECVMT